MIGRSIAIGFLTAITLLSTPACNSETNSVDQEYLQLNNAEKLVVLADFELVKPSDYKNAIDQKDSLRIRYLARVSVKKVIVGDTDIKKNFLVDIRLTTPPADKVSRQLILVANEGGRAIIQYLGDKYQLYCMPNEVLDLEEENDSYPLYSIDDENSTCLNHPDLE